MRVEYIDGMTYEEACTFYTALCGHVNFGNYDCNPNKWPSDACGSDFIAIGSLTPNVLLYEDEYSAHVHDWLSDLEAPCINPHSFE